VASESNHALSGQVLVDGRVGGHGTGGALLSCDARCLPVPDNNLDPVFFSFFLSSAVIKGKANTAAAANVSPAGTTGRTPFNEQHEITN
jgi:ubiquinone/menaquinone biosynthesis C-methylase UbiE